jgi:predicted DNA-binding transcriptional regulator AlpA
MSETEDKIILRRELSEKIKVTQETIRRWLKSGKLPPLDVHITLRTAGWKYSTLQQAGISLV